MREELMALQQMLWRTSLEIGKLRERALHEVVDNPTVYADLSSAELLVDTAENVVTGLIDNMDEEEDEEKEDGETEAL